MENKDLERAIYMWFDMKYEQYTKLETDDSIYLYDDGEKYADIRIFKIYGYIYYTSYFKDEFYEIFPLKIINIENYISKWVGHTFNFKELSASLALPYMTFRLEIPK